MALKVGVVRGGFGLEYLVSLKTGEAIKKAIQELSHNTEDIVITKDGSWLCRGFSTEPHAVCKRNDVIWNCLHGEYSEDGRFENDIAGFGSKIIGSTGWGSALCLNKDYFKRHIESYGFPVFPHVFIKPNEENPARKIHSSISGPWIIKPVKGGSSFGVKIAKSYPELEDKIKGIKTEVIVEPFYKGREIVVGIIPEFRGKKWYSTIVLEAKGKNNFLNSEDILNGSYLLLPLSDYGVEQKHALSEMAEIIGDILGLKYMYLTQWIQTDKGYFLIDVDALPALHYNSVFVKSFEMSGVSLKEIVENILKNI